jgi:hypothetical protein
VRRGSQIRNSGVTRPIGNDSAHRLLWEMGGSVHWIDPLSDDAHARARVWLAPVAYAPLIRQAPLFANARESAHDSQEVEDDQK